MVTINKTQYASRSEAARELLIGGITRKSEIARIVGMTPQTVHAVAVKMVAKGLMKSATITVKAPAKEVAPKATKKVAKVSPVKAAKKAPEKAKKAPAKSKAKKASK